MTRVVVELSDSSRNRAMALAKAQGVSLDKFVSQIVTEKVSVLDAERFFGDRAKRGTKAKYLAVLAKTGKEAAMKGDELPPSVKGGTKKGKKRG